MSGTPLAAGTATSLPDPTVVAAVQFKNAAFSANQTDRARLLGRTPGDGGVVAMPGYPPWWSTDVPNPDGTAAPYGLDPNKPYNLDYATKVRARQIFMHTDRIIEFARLVQGMTGGKLEHYVNDAATAGDTLQFLLIGTTASMLQRQYQAAQASGAPTQPPSADIAKVRDAMFQALAATAARAMAEARGAGAAPAASPFGVAQMSEAAQRRQAEILHTTMQQFYEKKDTAPAARSGAGGGSVPPQAGTTVGGTWRSAPAVARYGNDAALWPPPEPVRVLTEGEQTARASAASFAADKTAEGEAMRDPSVLLTFLLMRGGITPAEIKAVELLSGRSAAGAAGALSDDDLKRQRLLLDHADRLERMLLHSGRDGGHANLALEWLEAPQHTGFIFFSADFSAAVALALRDVHHLAQKPFALEIDLMTHEEVRSDFAALVAYHIEAAAASTRVLSRYGQKRDDRRVMHRGLLEKFRTLAYTFRLTPVRGQFLVFAGLDGVEERAREQAQRNDYMRTAHRYYDDSKYPDRRYY